MTDRWDAALYDQSHSFVNQMAGGLLALLNPKPGERILDLGCGTGPLTQKIADNGASVLGVDASLSMIAKARATYPSIHFEVMDALTMKFTEQFDAIFSNAALHWIKPPEVAVARMFEALKTQGRLVLEMGGQGNVAAILNAAIESGRSIGIDLTPVVDINYFPSIAQYTTLLERAGFAVGFAALFDRPTPLSDGEAGLVNWIKMFRPGVMELVPTHHRHEFESSLKQRCRDRLFHDGIWQADYRRLRITAVKKLAADADR